MEKRFGDVKSSKPAYKGMTTHSFYLPMRDGVKLAMDLVLPKGLSKGEKIPALLSQTRYWRAYELRAPFKWFLRPELLDPYYGGFQPYFTSHGYAIVLVDIRGTGASYGTWPYPWHKEANEDAREIIDWIVAQPWSNGKVAGYGISYLGTTAELLAVINHRAVKAIIPMFNHPDPYEDIAFPGGMLNERFIASWGYMDHVLDRNVVPNEFGLLGKLVVKGVKPVDGKSGRQQLEEAIKEHASNGDVYEMAKSVKYRDEQLTSTRLSIDDIALHRFNDTLDHAKPITFGWASWMDAGTANAVLRRFTTYDSAQRAVIGAWEHGGRFHASPYQPSNMPADPQLPQQWQEMKEFFDAHLKNVDNGVSAEKVLYYYTLGEEKWKKTNVWPPTGTKIQRWYFSEENQLSQTSTTADSGSDTYEVDFAASTGEYNRWWELGGLENKSVIYKDRAGESHRLLTYTSAPLAESMEITGHPIVKLALTSSEPDGGIFVYLEDVDERGRVTYITEGQLRLIHHQESDEEPPYNLQVPFHSYKGGDAKELIPGQVTEITFGLQPISVLIKKNHRIRISIAGHDQGTFDRVPLRGSPVLTVHRNNYHSSWIDLPIHRIQ
jgi:putative CocE/NonD family hydrolase